MSDVSKLLFSPVPYTVEKEEAAKNARKPGGNLDKDAFLQLLITQMKYQDPLNPMDDKDFLGQMAQFSALEQMQNLNHTFQKNQAYNMIGKTVEGIYQNPVTGETEFVEGFVDAVTTKGDKVFLTVDGKDINLDTISYVGDDYLTALQLSEILSNVSDARNQGFVGKYIQALTIDEETGNVLEYVEGVVDYIRTAGGQAVLMVNGREVKPSWVTGVMMPQTNDDGQVTNAFLIGRQTANGIITRIEITNNKASLVFHTGVKAQVERLDIVTAALDFVGKPIDCKETNTKGIVQSVTIDMGEPRFNVMTEDGIKELFYSEYKAR